MPLPNGINPEDHDIDELRVLTVDELRSFFVRRAWLRPKDWEDIKQLRDIGDMRQFALSCFVHGYLTAKA